MALTVEQRLTEAKAALHDLNLGRAAVEVTDSNGEKVRFQPSSVSRLKDYIADLDAEAAGTRRVSGPIRPRFAL